MPNFAANLTMLYNEVQFLERFKAASKAGFSGVEYMSPYEYPSDQLAGLLADNQLTQVLYNLPAGDWDSGERGIACHPSRIGEFQDGVGKAVEYSTVLECERINCLAGITPSGENPQKIVDTLIGNLKFASSELGKVGVQLLIEPINTFDIPGFYLTNTAQALSLIENVDSDNLWLQYDVYHMQIMEGDLIRSIETNLRTIRHLQVADNPGRNEPGTGEINYPFLFDALDKLGYDGWVGCEYKPLTTTVDGLTWADPYLRE